MKLHFNILLNCYFCYQNIYNVLYFYFQKAIEDKYGLPGSQLRVYFHYQPSFYHLHVHFTYLRHEAPGITTERAHLLSNVISNIEVAPHYYQQITLPFIVQENNSLFAKYEEKGFLKRVNLSVAQ